MMLKASLELEKVVSEAAVSDFVFGVWLLDFYFESMARQSEGEGDPQRKCSLQEIPMW